MKEKLDSFQMAPDAQQKDVPDDGIGPELSWMIARDPVLDPTHVVTFKKNTMLDLATMFQENDYEVAAAEAIDKILEQICNLKKPVERMDAILLTYGVRFAGTKAMTKTLKYAALCVSRNEREKGALAPRAAP